MYTQSQRRTDPTRFLALTIFAAALFMVGSLSTHAATAEDIQAQIDTLHTAIATQSGETVAPAVPVRPACRLTLDKKSYKLGETIKASWKTTGSSYVEFVKDTSGKDSLTVPDGKLDTADTASIVANVQGIPMITLRVTSETGHSVTCSKVFSVLPADASAKDTKVAPLQARLLQMANLMQKLVTQQEATAAKIMQLQIDSLMLQIKIDQIVSGPVSEVKGVQIEFLDIETTVIEDDTSTGNNYGKYTFEFEVIAHDTDVYIPTNLARGLKNTAAGVNFNVVQANATTSPAGKVTTFLHSTAEKNGNYYVVEEGDVEEFTAIVTFDPKTTGGYSVGLLKLNWNDTASAPDTKTVLKPADHFKSKYIVI